MSFAAASTSRHHQATHRSSLSSHDRNLSDEEEEEEEEELREEEEEEGEPGGEGEEGEEDSLDSTQPSFFHLKHLQEEKNAHAALEAEAEEEEEDDDEEEEEEEADARCARNDFQHKEDEMKEADHLLLGHAAQAHESQEEEEEEEAEEEQAEMDDLSNLHFDCEELTEEDELLVRRLQSCNESRELAEEGEEEEEERHEMTADSNRVNDTDDIIASFLSQSSSPSSSSSSASSSNSSSSSSSSSANASASSSTSSSTRGSVSSKFLSSSIARASRSSLISLLSSKQEDLRLAAVLGQSLSEENELLEQEIECMAQKIALLESSGMLLPAVTPEESESEQERREREEEQRQAAKAKAAAAEEEGEEQEEKEQTSTSLSNARALTSARVRLTSKANVVLRSSSSSSSSLAPSSLSSSSSESALRSQLEAAATQHQTSENLIRARASIERLKRTLQQHQLFASEQLFSLRRQRRSLLNKVKQQERNLKLCVGAAQQQQQMAAEKQRELRDRREEAENEVLRLRRREKEFALQLQKAESERDEAREQLLCLERASLHDLAQLNLVAKHREEQREEQRDEGEEGEEEEEEAVDALEVSLLNSSGFSRLSDALLALEEQEVLDERSRASAARTIQLLQARCLQLQAILDRSTMLPPSSSSSSSTSSSSSSSSSVLASCTPLDSSTASKVASISSPSPLSSASSSRSSSSLLTPQKPQSGAIKAALFFLHQIETPTESSMRRAAALPSTPSLEVAASPRLARSAAIASSSSSSPSSSHFSASPAAALAFASPSSSMSSRNREAFFTPYTTSQFKVFHLNSPPSSSGESLGAMIDITTPNQSIRSSSPILASPALNQESVGSAASVVDSVVKQRLLMIDEERHIVEATCARGSMDLGSSLDLAARASVISTRQPITSSIAQSSEQPSAASLDTPCESPELISSSWMPFKGVPMRACSSQSLLAATPFLFHLQRINVVPRDARTPMQRGTLEHSSIPSLHL